MSRLSTHLPQLASLALAVIAAAVSHSVHVDRSTGSPAGESRSQAPGRTVASGKPRHRSASTGSKAHRGHRTSRSRERHQPPARAVVMTVPAQPARARRPSYVDRLRAERGVKRGVDPAFEHVTVDARLAAPAPPVPTAPDVAATTEAPALDHGTGGVAAPTTTAPIAAPG
jgi:hypothetical protein